MTRRRWWLWPPMVFLLLAATAACGSDKNTASPFADCAALTAALTGAAASGPAKTALDGAAASGPAKTALDGAAASRPARSAAEGAVPGSPSPGVPDAGGVSAVPPGSASAASAPLPDMPDLRLPCFTGGSEVALREIRGPAVINLWASWCPPCRAELPVMQRLADQAAGRLHVVGVDVGDARDAGAAFAADKGVRMPTLFDQDKKLLNAVASINLPVTIFVDGNGRAYLHRLPLDEKTLPAEVKARTGVTVNL